MPWSDVEDCLNRAGALLAQMAGSPNRLVNLGLGNGIQETWTTPFYGSTTISGYVNKVLAPSAAHLAAGPSELDQITFSVAPASGKRVTCASPDGVNVATLNTHLLSAQQIIRAKFRAKVPDIDVCPADDATDAPEILKQTAFEIAAFTLANRLELQPLRWPTLAERYYWLLGGGTARWEKGDLNQIGSGSILDQLLPRPADILAPEGVSWDSEDAKFGDPADTKISSLWDM